MSLHVHTYETAAIRGDRGRVDLWVIGKEVGVINLPQTFASLRGSPRAGPFEGHLGAMSADILLT